MKLLALLALSLLMLNGCTNTDPTLTRFSPPLSDAIEILERECKSATTDVIEAPLTTKEFFQKLFND